MPSTKRYWQDLAQLDPSAEVVSRNANEFNAPLPIDQVLGDSTITGASTGRRDFLKFLGFSLSAATLAACETPVIKSIPYVTKPEDITPGVANWYASTYFDGDDFASVLVKTREGRPIMIKGNPRFGINRDPNLVNTSSINARINSSVVTLYDSERLQGPHKAGAASDWATADKAIAEGLAAAVASGKRAVLLSNTIISPSSKAAIAALSTKLGGKLEHVQYDTVSQAALTNANAKSFGQRMFPDYDLTQADVLVGIDADFLGGWGNATEYAWQYTSRRRPETVSAVRPMSRHWQFESRMSITGANADERIALKPSRLPLVALALYDAVAKGSGAAGTGAGSIDEHTDHAIQKCAEELLKAKGKSIVFSGSSDEGVQTVINGINALLGNYGTTIDVVNGTSFKQGDDAAVAQLVKDMNAGTVGALLIVGVNPAYSLPNAADFKEGLKKTALTVSFSGYADETASLCGWMVPDNHWLESWNDYSPKPGHYTTAQPTIRPLFDTRQWQESLLRWSGSTVNYHNFIQDNWRATMPTVAFTEVWNKGLHDGVHQAFTPVRTASAFAGDINAAAASARKSAEGAGAFELQLYTKDSIGNGLHANNPWLQEMPDPLTKVTWDNYVLMAPSDLLTTVGKKTFNDLYIGEQSPAYLLKVTVNGLTLELPAVPAPGMAPGAVAIALGYGRGENGERVGRAACLRNEDGTHAPVGKNAYVFSHWANGHLNYGAASATVEFTGNMYPLALTQTQMTDMDRHSVVKQTTFATWSEHKPHETYNHRHMLAVHADVNEDGVIDARDKVPTTEVDLWAEHPVAQVGHRWGMSIDLNGCIGCGACITACSIENNVPVVGKDEVRRSRDMHWLRLDRYYSSDMTHEKGKAEGKGKIERYLDMEVPSAQPKVVFMPVMCQHCNHAPCETVCPVAATTHSNEGLNQMAYNRCIGTRYCANNCPYKVRRFNWFNYVTEKFGQVNPAWDELGRMVLNPDVVVRSRGVIEKCSLCVQEIQATKLKAKKEGRPVRDGEVDCACESACGTGAIVFGDLNDPDSRISKLVKAERTYHALEEIGVQPNISYMAKVRNVEETEHHHA
ncbi:MAG TPA: TAT-variant-translocated molybdopterin oxidoreductase [Flavobacteriales bacterium]